MPSAAFLALALLAPAAVGALLLAPAAARLAGAATPPALLLVLLALSGGGRGRRARAALLLAALAVILLVAALIRMRAAVGAGALFGPASTLAMLDQLRILLLASFFLLLLLGGALLRGAPLPLGPLRGLRVAAGLLRLLFIAEDLFLLLLLVFRASHGGAAASSCNLVLHRVVLGACCRHLRDRQGQGGARGAQGRRVRGAAGDRRQLPRRWDVLDAGGQRLLRHGQQRRLLGQGRDLHAQLPVLVVQGAAARGLLRERRHLGPEVLAASRLLGQGCDLGLQVSIVRG
mmetsp:Transcript_98932/g.319024  ORF Transcript_98932/g.319024 Transcript_98932/m.319024 type:complete len:289 (-) Transcript_98932:367-1233(-)